MRAMGGLEVDIHMWDIGIRIIELPPIETGALVPPVLLIGAQ